MVCRHKKSAATREKYWRIDLKSNISAHAEPVGDPHDIYVAHLNFTAPLELQPLRCGPEGRVINVTEHRILVVYICRIYSAFVLIIVSSGAQGNSIRRKYAP
jgi:hypothetical protein